MALQSLAVPIIWPNMFGGFSNAPSVSTLATLDASGEYSATVHCASEDMVVSHVGFRTGTVAGAPTADVRIETVGTDGIPTGTLWATDTNIVTATLVTNTWALHALTAPATITKGQIFAIKIVYASGTSLITQFLGNSTGRNTPYNVTNTTGSDVKSGMGWARIAALGSSSTVFYPAPGLLPITAIAANAFNNTDAARRGMRFQVPFACQASGIRLLMHTATGDFNYALYSDAGTELSSSSTAFDGSYSDAANGSIAELYFDNAVTLSPGTWYRAAIEPSSATNCNMYTATLPSADYRTGMPGGVNCHYTTYVTDTWTDSATDQVPFMGIMINKLDDGASVGGAHVIGG